jgi:hypothetical protein
LGRIQTSEWPVVKKELPPSTIFKAAVPSARKITTQEKAISWGEPPTVSNIQRKTALGVLLEEVVDLERQRAQRMEAIRNRVKSVGLEFDPETMAVAFPDISPIPRTCKAECTVREGGSTATVAITIPLKGYPNMEIINAAIDPDNRNPLRFTTYNSDSIIVSEIVPISELPAAMKRAAGTANRIVAAAGQTDSYIQEAVL